MAAGNGLKLARYCPGLGDTFGNSVPIHFRCRFLVDVVKGLPHACSVQDWRIAFELADWNVCIGQEDR